MTIHLELPDGSPLTFRYAPALPTCERCGDPTDTRIEVPMPASPNGATIFVKRFICLVCVVELRQWWYAAPNRITPTNESEHHHG